MGRGGVSYETSKKRVSWCEMNGNKEEEEGEEGAGFMRMFVSVFVHRT